MRNILLALLCELKHVFVDRRIEGAITFRELFHRFKFPSAEPILDNL